MSKTIPHTATELYVSLTLDWNGTPAVVTSYANYKGSISMTVDRGGKSFRITPGMRAIFQARTCADCGSVLDDNHAEYHLAMTER